MLQTRKAQPVSTTTMTMMAMTLAVAMRMRVGVVEAVNGVRLNFPIMVDALPSQHEFYTNA
jgi:hypothetical protein